MRNKIRSDLDEVLPYLLDRVTKKIQNAKLDFTPLDDGSGYGGSYSVLLITNKDNPTDHVFDIRIADSNYKKLHTKISFFGTKEQAEEAYKALSNLFEKEYRAFSHKLNRNNGLIDLDDDKLKFIVRRKLKTLENKFPDEFSFNKNGDDSKKYILSLTRSLPTRAKNGDLKENIHFRIRIRDHSCIERIEKEYIEDAVLATLSIGTKETNRVAEIEEKVRDILKEYSIFEYTLKSSPTNIDKAIPKNWIEPDKIRVLTERMRNGENNYDIAIVPKSTKNRIPKIILSLSNASYDEAKKIRDYLESKDGIISDYLHGKHKDDPLTVKMIRNDLENKFPDIVNRREAAAPKRSDIRNVICNNDIKMTLLTPKFVRREQSVEMQIVSPKESRYTHNIRKTISVPLNTSDSDLAFSRINALQSLTKIALEEYFQDNPDTQIATEPRVTKKHGNGVAFIEEPPPGQTAPEGKIFFNTLRDDVLKPAYEQFNRYIYWETKIEKEKGGDGYTITAQVKRNKDAEEFPENDNILGREWKFKAKDEKGAIEFSHQLEENILRKEHLFSRERPVDQFGANSMRLVTKKSLLEAVGASPDIEDLQKNLTKHLKVETRRIP
ncbi:MAG: hypothetical protein R3D71_02585 [Rickettsiales bacterium]